MGMTLDAEVRSLRQVPMFAGVDPARLKLLAFASERTAYAEGDELFALGDASDAAYVILEGEVSVRIRTPAGPLEVARLGANAVVGEMGVILDAPRTASVTAVRPTVALKVKDDVFFEMLKEFPKIALAVMRDLATRLERTNQRLAAAAH